MLEYTPYVLPFLISAPILLYLSIYAFRLRTRVESAGLFSLLTLALTVWTVCYALELASVSLEDKIFWVKLKYVGATPGPVLWFVFSLYYTNHRNWLTRPLQILLGAFIFLTLGIVFTNEIHHWYWTRIYLTAGFPETQSDHGFYFWVYAAGVYVLILASVVIYTLYYRTVPAYFRMQAVLMVLGGFVPLAARIPEDFLGWDLIPKLDNIIVFFLVSAILFFIAVFRYGAFQILPIAHDLIVQNINSGILVLNRTGDVVEVNPYAGFLIGSESRNAIGKPLDVVLGGWPKLNYSPELKEQVEQEISLSTQEGTSFLLVQISPIRNHRHIFIGHVLVFVDITDRKFAEMELQRLARTDVLTGVTNRRHFFEVAKTHFARAQRYNHPLAILMLDVDHFKQVNDRYGHLAGDLILQVVARECQSRLRGSDVFARYGGEEFICLLPEQDGAGAFETAEKIRRIIEQAQTWYELQPICVTASVGVAVMQNEVDLTLEGLINRADQALYESKSNGRNQVSLWQGG